MIDNHSTNLRMSTKIVKKCVITLGLLLLRPIFAELKYCSGTVEEITVRDSHEATHVVLKTASGRSGYARIGSDEYSANQEIQVSILLAAYLNGQLVELELNTNGYFFDSCENFEVGLPVRFVRLP